jgi:hypothetical protein
MGFYGYSWLFKLAALAMSQSSRQSANKILKNN